VFITDRLIYLHLPKTGGEHITYLLADCIGGAQVGKHNRLANTAIDKCVVGSIRNPWDWYVSLWAFGCSARGAVYRRVTGRHGNYRWLMRRGGHEMWRYKCMPVWVVKEFLASRRAPAALWSSVYTDSMDAKSFRAWLRLMFDARRSSDFGEGYGESSIHRFAGFLTYSYLWLYSRDVAAITDRNRFSSPADLREFDAGNNVLDGVIRNETLEDDLVRVRQQPGRV
jgi:hypothetical protein